MKYFLDTNIIVYAVKGMFPKIRKHFERIPATSIVVPSIVCAELEYGARRSKDYAKTKALYDAFLREFLIVPFDKTAAKAYGKIRHQLEGLGEPIGPNDLVIAATAMGGCLVTHDVREFSRIEGLRIEDWT